MFSQNYEEDNDNTDSSCTTVFEQEIEQLRNLENIMSVHLRDDYQGPAEALERWALKFFSQPPLSYIVSPVKSHTIFKTMAFEDSNKKNHIVDVGHNETSKFFTITTTRHKKSTIT